MDRRRFLQAAGTCVASGLVSGCAALNASNPLDKPNFIIIFADDLGYGDLGCFGHPTLHTPNLDRMAAEGMKLTQFYAAAPVCTPSRAALLTGRLPIRNGMCGDGKHRNVLFPDSAGGLPDEEITIARALKNAGYVTACVGKWHLGHLPQFLPTRRGFDCYYGIPYSNDMKPTPVLEDEKTVEEPADLKTLTRRYTERTTEFIESSRRKPFFLYFAHTFPHVPLEASDSFKDSSLRGLYGDVVEELDWSVGQILETLRRTGLDKNTLVVFTSDNGPWRIKKGDGGSAGLLRGGKGTTWEGGVREPAIAWWPGKIRPGCVHAGMSSTLDLFPTLLDFAGVPMPTDRVYDGWSLQAMLLHNGKSPRDTFFYYRDSRLMAVRSGPWKAHFHTYTDVTKISETPERPLLFQLEHDPGEQYDVSAEQPEIVDRLRQLAEAHKASFQPPPSQLTAIVPVRQ